MSLTSYSPVPHTPMTLWEHVRLAFNQLVSFGLSTFFLLGVVMWAMAAEALYAIPNFFKRVKAPKYEWDDDRYWRREGKKISKEPRDYARQIGLDIENQTVETEDGYYLRYVAILGRLADLGTGCTRSWIPMRSRVPMVAVSLEDAASRTGQLTSRRVPRAHSPRPVPVVRLVYYVRGPLARVLARA